jgi:hypothetical protein
LHQCKIDMMARTEMTDEADASSVAFPSPWWTNWFVIEIN